MTAFRYRVVLAFCMMALIGLLTALLWSAPLTLGQVVGTGAAIGLLIVMAWLSGVLSAIETEESSDEDE